MCEEKLHEVVISSRAGMDQRDRARPAPTLIRSFSEADDRNCVVFPSHFQLQGADRIFIAEIA